MFRRIRALSLLFILSACGTATAASSRVTVHPTETTIVSHTRPEVNVALAASDALLKRQKDLATVLRVVASQQAYAARAAAYARAVATTTTTTTTTVVIRGVQPSTCDTPTSSDLPTIAACIKACESGNYAESSHPWDGSGAYQFIPRTWQTYSALAGYPGYTYAYEASPNVQDAVMTYTVEHGGAHNWDPRFGKDPCTVNLP